jgi:hypothetical protein
VVLAEEARSRLDDRLLKLARRDQPALVERDLGEIEHRRERVGIVVAMLAADVVEAPLGGFVPAVQR